MRHAVIAFLLHISNTVAHLAHQFWLTLGQTVCLKTVLSAAVLSETKQQILKIKFLNK